MPWSSAIKLLIRDYDDEEGLIRILEKLPKDNIFTLSCTGSSALHFCCLSEKPKSANLLLFKGIDVNIRNDFDETPLHWAVQSGSKNVCELLLKHGADVNVKDCDGNTPLHWACENNSTEILDVLINWNNIDLNIENSDGMTPLDVAMRNGNCSWVKKIDGNFSLFKKKIRGIKKKKRKQSA